MARRIKILFTIPNFDTAGSGKVVYDLVKGLDSTQFAPEICCFHNRGAYFEVVQSLGVPIHIFEFAVPYRPFISLPWRILKLSRFFKRHQFDVIHSWHWSSDFTEPLAAKLVGIPYVYTKKAMGWGNKSWICRSRLSTKIIALNSDMISQFFLKFNNKTEYIPLGVDLDYYHPRENQRQTPEGLKFKPTDMVIVTVANLVPIKGVEVLLNAVKGLNNSNLIVLIVGDDSNSYGTKLKQKFSTTKVHFLGKKLDVRPYLAVSDIFVLPTLTKGEGLPVSILEAMASRRLVIGSNVSGIKDILSPFSSFLFEAGNVKSLENTLTYVMSLSHEEKNKIAEHMLSYISESYSLSSVIKSHENLYETIINKI